ncbi:MAG: MFS transporter [Acidimicrobiales bacterium]
MTVGPRTGHSRGSVVAESATPARRGMIFTLIAMALLMMSIDSTIVATALRSIQHGLGTSINWAGWTLTAYSFGFLLMLPLSGKLSERYSRRGTFLGSVVVFTVASLLCGAAGNIYVLIALRAVQAAGGAGFTPSATGIIVDHFGPARDRAVSLFGSIFPIGSMIGPIFGGLFVTYWSWRGVFFVNAPIGLAVIVLALRHVPSDPPRKSRANLKLDAIGMGLLGIGVLLGMLAISYLGEKHAKADSAIFIVPIVIAVLTIWWFLRHIKGSNEPFIAPRLIYGYGFGAVNLINSIYGGVPLGAVALIPLYATNRYHIGALNSGTLLIANGIAAVILSTVVALALRRTGYRVPLFIGSAVIVAGMILLALRPPWGVPPYGWLACGAFLVGAGAGTINPPCRNAGLQLAPEQSATLAALRTMGLQIGSITTISIATALLAATGDPGGLQAWFYLIVALALTIGIPVVTRIPEHRGAW